MPAALRLLAVVVPIGLLAWASVAVLDRSNADRPLRLAVTEMRTWGPPSRAPQPGTWQVVNEQLASAESASPSDPTIQELRARLGLRSENPAEQSQVEGRLIRALTLRPVSPYTWANLVEAKYRQGEPGPNLQLAIQRAAELGPSEPGVQLTIADYGLAVWDEIDAPTQAAVDRLVAAGFRRNPLEMLRISERRGRLDTACRHLDGYSRTPDPSVATRCKSWETTQ